MAKLTRRDALGALSVPALAAVSGAAAAQAPKTTSRLLLVNDIYKLSPDKGRGGFAKLAAIVKAERARGVPMLFAHAGDTFSPSLMSGFDQGEHIVTLTNMVKPDIFVPGNHEFDFGKDIYVKRIAESNFPIFAANMRRSRRPAAAAAYRPAYLRSRRHQGRRHRHRARRDAADVEPGDIKFLPDHRDA